MDSNKKFIVLGIFILLLFTNLYSQDINGDTLTIEGKKILLVYGDNYERGYAHGYLMGSEIAGLIEEYFFIYVFQNNPVAYNFARDYFENNFTIENDYITESIGIIDGMEDAGIDLYYDFLDRELDATDILIENSILEIRVLAGISHIQFGCSSISSWGSSTQNCDELLGESIITRHLDWQVVPALTNRHLLMVSVPADDNKLAFASFGFPGMIGILSGINEEGVSALLNVGNHSEHTVGGMYHPVFLSIRNGLEQADYNQDGETNPLDVADAVSGQLLLSDNIIHSIASTDKQEHAIVIECNNENGTEIRRASDNTVINGDNLVATNHFRKLYDSEYCFRYNNISDSLAQSTEMDPQRSWNLLKDAAGISNNLQTIQLTPSTLNIKWGTTENGIYSYDSTPVNLNLPELINLTPINSKSTHLAKRNFDATCFPNPFNPVTNINLECSESGYYKIDIFNIKGELVHSFNETFLNPGSYSYLWNASENSSGIYFYQAIFRSSGGQTSKSTNKFVLLK